MDPSLQTEQASSVSAFLAALLPALPALLVGLPLAALPGILLIGFAAVSFVRMPMG